MKQNRKQIRCISNCALSITALMLAGCTTIPGEIARGDVSLSQLHLFGDGTLPRFTFYLACAGDVSAEIEMCWVPRKYFSTWAGERQVFLRQLPSHIAFDPTQGLPTAQLSKGDSGFDYRIVVQYVPIATPSYTSVIGSSSGNIQFLPSYVPPKAGYNANVYVYASASGKLIAQANYHKRTAAPYQADAIPFIKSGVHDVIAALDPAYVSSHLVD